MISPLASICKGAQLGRNVAVGEFTIVHPDVEIGDDCIIESHCVIGYPTPLAQGLPLRIGPGALIRSHSVVYVGSAIGEQLVTGHHVVIREKSAVGQHCQIGSYTELQGDLTFGDFSRTQSSVFLPKHTTVGKAVWLMPRVTLTNDPHPPSEPGELGVHIGDFAVLAAACTVLPGVHIGTRSLVAAHSLVTKDVAPDTVVGGVPAKPMGMTSEIQLRDGSGPAYPWMRHFHRGYPKEMVEAWIEEYGSNIPGSEIQKDD
jgi:acetyltransferase-like isoleucine patch superfamily enzyme